MTDHKIVLVDAHRGASVSFPENTLAAFEAGVAAGADSVEFDVQLSADGVAVVIHDDTVDRTTNGTGAVSELTLAELQSLDAGSWKAPSFAGERIPSLDEALTLLTKYVRINMELKSADPRLAERAIEAIERHGVHRRLMASSFHLQHLLTIKERLPEVQTNYLLEEAASCGLLAGRRPKDRQHRPPLGARLGRSDRRAARARSTHPGVDRGRSPAGSPVGGHGGGVDHHQRPHRHPPDSGGGGLSRPGRAGRWLIRRPENRLGI